MRTMSSELAMTPRRAPESPMGNVSPSLGSPASENKPKPWPGVILYGKELLYSCCIHGLHQCAGSALEHQFESLWCYVVKRCCMHTYRCIWSHGTEVSAVNFSVVGDCAVCQQTLLSCNLCCLLSTFSCVRFEGCIMCSAAS